MKKSIKLFLVLFTFALLTNCQQEEDVVIVESSQQIINTTIQNQSFDKFSVSQLKNEPLFNEITNSFNLDKVLENSKAQKNRFLKSNSDQDLNIDINSVIKIEKNQYTSYTFHIERPNKKYNEIENLVIEKQQDTIRGFLLNIFFLINT